MLNLREELRFRNEQLMELQRVQNAPPETSRSVQSMINRAEREKVVLQVDIDRLRSEANMLHDRWMEANEALRIERDRGAAQQDEWQQLRRRLEGECNAFASQQLAELSLQKKLKELETINRKQAEDLVKLQTEYQQLKYGHIY